jgi:hypothetical protein
LPGRWLHDFEGEADEQENENTCYNVARGQHYSMKEDISSSPIDRPPTKADYRRYQALLTDIGRHLELAGRALYRLGGALKTIRDERLYRCGGYTTFQDFCARELGLAREYIFRTIQAYDLLCELLTAGVSQLDLPTTERVCRELAAVPAGLRPKVWKRARRLAEKQGEQPDSRTVKEAAVEVLGSPEVKERQVRELVQKFEAVARSLQIGLTPDSLSEDDRAQLKAKLDSIGSALTALQKQL